MKKASFIIIGLVATFCFGFSFKTIIMPTPSNLGTLLIDANGKEKKEKDLKLGAFSISLSVKDLTTSKRFYESLGFKESGGGMEKKYLIMKNGNALIGLFQGMFQGNILTFNPGWDENAKNIKQFDDVRDIQRHLKGEGISLVAEADEKTSGPASLMLTDPDGNLILVDQHR